MSPKKSLYAQAFLRPQMPAPKRWKHSIAGLIYSDIGLAFKALHARYHNKFGLESSECLPFIRILYITTKNLEVSNIAFQNLCFYSSKSFPNLSGLVAVMVQHPRYLAVPAQGCRRHGLGVNQAVLDETPKLGGGCGHAYIN